MKKYLFVFSFLSISLANAQNIATGSWRTMFSYAEAKEVEAGRGKVYCSTVGGIFIYDTEDESIEYLSKTNGLSQNVADKIKYDSVSNTLVITYQNSDIDLYQDGKITNISDLKDAAITGSKRINNVLFHNGFVYFSCDFGILVLNLERQEIADTYYLGNNGTNMIIYNTAINGNIIMALSENGILEADFNNPNLANFQNWTYHGTAQDLPAGKMTSIVTFDSKIVGNPDGKSYNYNGSKWVKSIYADDASNNFNVTNGILTDNNYYSVKVLYNLNGESIRYFFSKRFESRDAVFYNNILYYTNNGPLQMVIDTTYTNILPPGPAGPGGFHIRTTPSQVYIATAPLNGYNSSFFRGGVSVYDNGSFLNINESTQPKMSGLVDAISTAPEKNGRTFYIAGIAGGIAKVENNEVTTLYNPSNSTIRNSSADPGITRITGITVDNKDALWVCNDYADKPFLKKDKAGKWSSFNLPVFGNFKITRKIFTDSYNQKWACIDGGGVVVFDEGTNGQLVYKHITSGAGSGNLANEAKTIFDITEDKDGIIWLVTSKGVYTVSNAFEILEPDAPYDAQPVTVVQEGFIQNLLESENCLAIAVDGGNRKWISTANGVFLFSADGQKQILAFNSQNSPLPEVQINSIAVQPTTGEVYMGTSQGVYVYRADATEPTLDNSAIKIFPNPVAPNYTGVITIQGLATNSRVKITDLVGNIVNECVVNGGTATWNATTFNNVKAAPGVYFAQCTSIDGLNTSVQKILIQR